MSFMLGTLFFIFNLAGEDLPQVCRLLIYLHRYAGSVDGAVACETFADNFMGHVMGNHIIKAQFYPFKF